MQLRILSFLLLLFGNVQTVFSQSAGKVRDSITILQSRADSRDQVYIEYERSAAARKDLFNFTLDAVDSQTLQMNYVAALSDTPERNSHCLPAKQNMHGLATQWLPLYQYKGALYLYEPCDKGSRDRLELRPRMLLHYYMDGPAVELLQEVSKESATWYRIVTYLCGPEGRDPDLYQVHLLDKAGQLAVWEHVGTPEAERYELRVTPAGAAAYNLIINECPENKESEWDGFETIDFKKLLSAKR